MADGTGTSTWSYDSEGRVMSLVQPQGTTTREYDSWGRMTKLSQGSGNDINYGFTNHRLTSITKMPENEVTSFVFDSNGRMNRQNNSNGTYTEYGFDSLDRQNSIVHKNSSGSVLSSESYVYDAAGNLTSKLADGVSTTFGYDAIDQLLSEVRSGYSASYTYDNNGNRLTRTLNGTTENYAYDSGDKLLSVSIGGITTKAFSYDARGNTTGITTSSGTQSFTYNAEDKPISITAPGLSQTNAFNGAGARTSKVVDGTSTSFKRSSPGVTAPLLAAGSSTFNPGISEKQGGVTHTQLSDRLGTLKGTTNASQSVTSTKQFDAFGNLTSSSGIASLKGFATDYGYQEDENGLKQVGHRLYDPSLGRFLTRDPIGSGLNWFAYCGNNPTKFVDSDGLTKKLLRAIKLRVHVGRPNLGDKAVGHAWIILEFADGTVETLELQPQGHLLGGGPTDDALQNHAGTRRREYDEELVQYVSVMVDPDELRRKPKNRNWTATNNCCDYAMDIYTEVTGQGFRRSRFNTPNGLLVDIQYIKAKRAAKTWFNSASDSFSDSVKRWMFPPRLTLRETGFHGVGQ